MTDPEGLPSWSAELVSFSTSGSTGAPVHWLRTPAQLRDEVVLVSEVAVGPVEQVVSFAPPEHLFGRLFGRELPAWLGIPVLDAWRKPTTPPVVEPGARTLFVCVPASWPLMRAIAPRIAELPGAVALHGTGPLPRTAGTAIHALANADFRAVEIFGSTEAGGIAVREFSDAEQAPWQLLPDVTLIGEPGGERLLRIASPRLARRADAAEAPTTWRSGDLVRIVDDRHFHLVGRTSRLVKVNGLRCDLGSVEQAASARLAGLDVVAVSVSDDTRGEHYELYYAAEQPVDPATFAETMVDAGLPVPRRVHRVRGIPRTPSGKVRLDQLTALD